MIDSTAWGPRLVLVVDIVRITARLALGVAFLWLLLSALIRRLRERGKKDPLISPNIETGLLPPGPLTLPRKEADLHIGPYKVLSHVGQGGMGTVYKAEDQQGRTVAIKMIGGLGRDRMARVSEHARMALVREARLASGLSNPNIVKIYDIGQEKGNLYVVMEYLQGLPLDGYVRKHQPSVAEGLRITAELCDALSYAHSVGVIHRDVKPANTFVGSDGRVKVLDFGLAVMRDAFSGCVLLGGTPPYMSPEQISGKSLDGRTDVWSAGVMLFEILTGKLPFIGDNLRDLAQQIVAAAPPKLLPTHPCAAQLDLVLQKALAKNREARYASASDFATDLRSLHRIIQAMPTEGQVVASPVGIPFVLDPATVPASNVLGEPELAQHMFVNLGFAERFSAQVFFPQAPRSTERPPLRKIIPYYFVSLIGLALGQTIVGLLVLAATILMQLLFILRSCRCRSCKGKMYTASLWTRPAWLLLEKKGFCVSDCVAALKEGLWEDAVKLLWAYTSTDQSGTEYRLEFRECRRCGDQSAYLTLQKHEELEPSWIVEAYRFRDPRNAQRLMKTANLSLDVSALDKNARTETWSGTAHP